MIATTILTVAGCTLEVEYEATYQAAKVSGPPEDCYPAAGELDLLHVTLMEGEARPTDALIEEACWEHFFANRFHVDDGPDEEG